MKTLSDTVSCLVPDLAQSVAIENMQSRIRGMILMARSNSSKSIVLATGNKSEMAVGYATLYGDMAGGFLAQRYPKDNGLRLGKVSKYRLQKLFRSG